MKAALPISIFWVKYRGFPCRVPVDSTASTAALRAEIGKRRHRFGPRQGSVRLRGTARRAAYLWYDYWKEVNMANVVRYDPFDLLEGVMKSVLRRTASGSSASTRSPWRRPC